MFSLRFSWSAWTARQAFNDAIGAYRHVVDGLLYAVDSLHDLFCRLAHASLGDVGLGHVQLMRRQLIASEGR